ncbi:peroxiredoxin family protein [Anaerolineae bacterium CFX7]|nr:peroxiredoxin family protein [Anaerolineae bacterium CFX7]RIK34002.1 MAG: thioredoxin peroxidase [Chloroflexota bacterium]
MAQLRQHYDEFVKRDTEILAIGPEPQLAFKMYWAKEKLPFIGLADPKHVAADAYEQEVSLLKWGRMPALMIVDKKGHIRFKHYAENMRDYPTLPDMLSPLDELRRVETQRAKRTVQK